VRPFSFSTRSKKSAEACLSGDHLLTTTISFHKLLTYKEFSSGQIRSHEQKQLADFEGDILLVKEETKSLFPGNLKNSIYLRAA